MTALLLTSTLDDELVALARGESDECLVCGSVVSRRREAVACPECGARVEEESRQEEKRRTPVQFDVQAG